MEEPLSLGGWTLMRESAALPDGRMKEDVRVHRCDAVHIIALPSPDTVLLLREFRPFYGTHVWMLPGGKLDKETDAVAAAHRELREETGFAAEEMTPYCVAHFSESVDIASRIFIARDLTPSPLPQDPDEFIEVHESPIEEALENVLRSSTVHMPSAFALLRFVHERHHSAR